MKKLKKRVLSKSESFCIYAHSHISNVTNVVKTLSYHCEKLRYYNGMCEIAIANNDRLEFNRNAELRDDSLRILNLELSILNDNVYKYTGFDMGYYMTRDNDEKMWLLTSFIRFLVNMADCPVDVTKEIMAFTA